MGKWGMQSEFGCVGGPRDSLPQYISATMCNVVLYITLSTCSSRSTAQVLEMTSVQLVRHITKVLLEASTLASLVAAQRLCSCCLTHVRRADSAASVVLHAHYLGQLWGEL